MTKTLIVSRLRPILTQSKTQRDNPALFQVINSLIDQVDLSASDINTIISGGTTPPPDLSDLTFITEVNESADLPNSRQLLPGSGILFDYSIVNQLQIKVSPSIITGGDVVGPSSAVNNSVALYDGITGKLIKDASQVTINPTSGDIQAAGIINSGSASFDGRSGFAQISSPGNIYLTSNTKSLTWNGVDFSPEADNIYDLGKTSAGWRNLFLSSYAAIGTNPAQTGAIRLA